jgi:hypothetical protein
LTEARDRESAEAAGLRLSPVGPSSLFVGAVRLVLCGVFLGAAVAQGMELRAALAGLAAGAVVLAVLFAGPASRRRLRAGEPAPAPSGARYDQWWTAGLRALFPSTVVVAVMSVIALFSSRALVSILAGVLGAMGVLAFVAGADALLRERRGEGRLYSASKPHAGTFVAPR